MKKLFKKKSKNDNLKVKKKKIESEKSIKNDNFKKNSIKEIHENSNLKLKKMI